MLENILYCVDDISQLDFSLNSTFVTQIVNTFNEYGALLIKESNKYNYRLSLNNIKSVFGNAVLHNMSDADGFHPIEYIPGFSEYGNTTNDDLDFHTDGSFEKLPPKILILRCLKADKDKGGMSRILDGKVIYEHLTA